MSDKFSKKDERAFSIELKDNRHVKLVSISNREEGSVLIEGTLGRIEKVNLIDEALLELKGVHGILRVDVRKEDLEDLLQKQQADSGVGRE